MAKYLTERVKKILRINRYLLHAALLSIFVLGIYIISMLYAKLKPNDYIETVSNLGIICLGWIPVASLIMVLFVTNYRQLSSLLGKDKFRVFVKTVATSGFGSIFIVIFSYAYRIVHDMLGVEFQYWLAFAITFCFILTITNIILSFALLANLAIYQLED